MSIIWTEPEPKWIPDRTRKIQFFFKKLVANMISIPDMYPKYTMILLNIWNNYLLYEGWWLKVAVEAWSS